MTTFGLVPGGGGDPWDWHRLVPEMKARGHDVVAVRLPEESDEAGLSEYADTIVEALGDAADVTLVAHSLGGFSAPLVGECRPIALLVLVNAMLPRPAETGEAWWPKPLSRWPDVPTRVLAGRHDRFLPASAQKRLARERLGIEADVMDGGHMLALSQPRRPRGPPGAIPGSGPRWPPTEPRTTSTGG